MKRIIRASEAPNRTKARTILNKSKELLDVIENAPEGVIEEYDLNVLYEELIDIIPSLSRSLEK